MRGRRTQARCERTLATWLFATSASEGPKCQFKGSRACLRNRREMIRQWFKSEPNGAKTDPAWDRGPGRAYLSDCSEHVVYRVDLLAVTLTWGSALALPFFITLCWLASCYSTTPLWIPIVRIPVNLRCLFREPAGHPGTGWNAGVWKSLCRQEWIDGAPQSERWREHGPWYWRHCASGNWNRGFEARRFLLKPRMVPRAANPERNSRAVNILQNCSKLDTRS